MEQNVLFPELTREDAGRANVERSDTVAAPAVADAHMACEDNLDFMRRLPNGCMKLVVTSPPYNIGKSYERRSHLDAYVEQQTRVISECVRLTHSEGSICWQVGNHVDKGEVVPLDTILYPIFKSHGFKLRNRIVWHFEHGLHCSKRLSGRYETIMWFTKEDCYTFNLAPFGFHQSTPIRSTSKAPSVDSCQGTRMAKIRVTFG